MVNRLRRIFTPFKCGGKSAKSKYFCQLRHVWIHIWSSPSKAADTEARIRKLLAYYLGLTAEYPATRSKFHLAGYAVRRK